MLASRIEARLKQLRRDAASVGRRLAGARPAPIVRRPTERPLRGEALVVARVVRETPSTVTLVLRHPARAPFAFRPGQFFTVTKDGAARNYSASNLPFSSELHLTIKRKEGGRLSPILCAAAPGDRLSVAGPYGSFGRARGRRLVLVAGGVGITPLWSIARAALAEDPESEVALLYGTRSASETAFGDAIDALARAEPTRLFVRHVRDDRGERLDRETTARLVAELPESFAGAGYLVCGPDAMTDAVLAALSGARIPEARVSTERFVVASRAPARASAAPRAVVIHSRGREHRAAAADGATLLEAGLAAGAPMPFSCSVGGCGACRVRLASGDVTMDEPNCLEPAEREAGWVLACVGRPGPGGCTIRIEDDA